MLFSEPPSFITFSTLAKSACSVLTAAVFSKQLFSEPPPERKRVLQLLADRRHLLVVACKTIYTTKLYVLHTSLKLNLPHRLCLWTFLKHSNVLPIPESPKNIANMNYITFDEPIGLFANDFMFYFHFLSYFEPLSLVARGKTHTTKSVRACQLINCTDWRSGTDTFSKIRSVIFCVTKFSNKNCLLESHLPIIMLVL